MIHNSVVYLKLHSEISLCNVVVLAYRDCSVLVYREVLCQNCCLSNEIIKLYLRHRRHSWDIPLEDCCELVGFNLRGCRPAVSDLPILIYQRQVLWTVTLLGSWGQDSWATGGSPHI